MTKTWLIIKREYLSRVTKKSFVIMSLLGPLLMAGVVLFSVWLGQDESENQKILVVDEKYPMFKDIKGNQFIQYDIAKVELDEALQKLKNQEYTGVLHIVGDVYKNKSANLYFIKQPSFRVQRQIEETFQQYIEIFKLSELNISENDYRRLKSPFLLIPLKYDGSENDAETVDYLPSIVGLVLSVIIYMFILLYSIQVMRGVIEEKTNRIVEVLISSVKPIQLMFGKIIGVGAVGLTQFVIWTVLTASVIGIGKMVLIDSKYSGQQAAHSVNMTKELQNQMDQEQAVSIGNLSDQNNLFSQLNRINFPLILGMFVFYFLGGFFLYSAMMAAVGSAVDSDTDTQQFMLPITFPLLLSYIAAFSVFDNPTGSLAQWMSIIPFTSPVIMTIRISMNAVEPWELALSMVSLLATFILVSLLSAKIYRTGILMYGKKASYREIYKWLKHK